MKLEDALALLHGAKSATFYKKARGVKREQDWLCFSLVFKERTLDFAATNAQALLDWYLGLAQLIPHSTEPLLDETTLAANRSHAVAVYTVEIVHYIGPAGTKALRRAVPAFSCARNDCTSTASRKAQTGGDSASAGVPRSDLR